MFFPKYSEIGAEEDFNPVSFQLVVAHDDRQVEIRVTDSRIFPVDQPDGIAVNDVAELVDGGMQLEEAEAAARERETAEKMDRELRIEHLYQLSNFATQICSDTNLSATRELFTKHTEN